MKKQFGEVLKSKAFAVWVVLAFLVMAAVVVTFKVNTSVRTFRYTLGDTDTVEDIDREIDNIENELAELESTPGYTKSLARGYRDKILVLEELKRNFPFVKADELYQGPMMTGAEDSTAYLFNLINVALFMSLATAFILSCVLITREFDEGVHIHVYYEKRTRNVLARGAVVLIFTVVFFLAMYLFLSLASGTYPQVFTKAVVVDRNRAYFMNIGKYKTVYGLIRYLYMTLFGAVTYVAVAITVKKTLPHLLISAALTGLVVAAAKFLRRVPDFIGLGDSNGMTYVPKWYYNISVLWILLPVLAVVLALAMFEKQDL